MSDFTDTFSSAMGHAMLELAIAEKLAAEERERITRALLASVVGILRRQGGFMKAEDQAMYRAACEMLVEEVAK